MSFINRSIINRSIINRSIINGSIIRETCMILVNRLTTISVKSNLTIGKKFDQTVDWFIK